jgi:putative addiction module component (TIGR02574 family)
VGCGNTPAAFNLRYSESEQRMSNLQNEIGALSAAEKFELLDALWESLEAESLPLTNEQRAELDYRAARYRENPADVIPWEQVRADLHKGR